MSRVDVNEGRTSTPQLPRMAVVIPVRDARELLAPCLRSITPQLRTGDRLIVVDDGSTDGSDALAAALGADVLRAAEPSGPYAARNTGWRATSHDVVVFTDVRCRARPDWLELTRAAFADASAAMVCSDLDVAGGHTTATQVMRHRQTFRAHHTSARHFFLPYFPTCNLAVRRSALEGVQGFTDIRSGGDADFCWRVQLAGYGHLVAIDRVTMDWVARTNAGDLLTQWARYGRAQADLRHRFRRDGMDLRPPGIIERLEGAMRVVGSDLLRHRLPLHVAALDGLTTWVHAHQLARHLRRRRRALS
ncbi:hypothetical protein BH23ACT10_BH23ACT10_32560 [soil metagenome]